MSPASDSVQVLHSNVLQGNVIANRFLRTNTVGDEDDEERAGEYQGGPVSVKNAAKELDILEKVGAEEHMNWNALVKYIQMHHKRITRKELSSEMAKIALLSDILK
ncbi:putative secreted RxLR effector peptide protein [Phytophthora cinnamomi]|uniref:putative secreted RxLR effector peptide protein n=1 Tax=Phytophthora cinnamomi TaxID=4785 RepID=UPI00355944D6|nr:putative secreted RxLR effector peptide protein [Phytophthora cinnamomi]